MTPTSVTSPLTPAQLVDEYFIENRNRVVEIAAFLDRLDRAAPDTPLDDFRVQALRGALALILSSPAASRVTSIQMMLSDPTSRPLDALDRKGAVGAYDGSHDDRP
ncbi:MAG: hypothetical protein ABI051_02160 [Vicinamibacterales bacterium]